MQTRYSPADYLYISARIRALENGLIGKDKINTLLTARTEAELIAALRTEGVVPAKGADPEDALLALLRESTKTVKQSVPDVTLVHLIEYPYDCHNIKSYLKAAYRGVDPDTLFIDAGSLPVAKLTEALQADNLSALPQHMAAAIPAAKEAFARTADPREIDFLIDRALFADLSVAAAGLPFAEKLVRARADLTNFIICLRLLRGKNRAIGVALLEKAMLPAGTLPQDFFEKAFEQGESELLSRLAVSTPYGRVVAGADKRTLAEIEKTVDDYLMALVREVKYISFGAEIPLAYLWGLETSIKNLRILLAGKKAGLDGDALRERVRESYV